MPSNTNADAKQVRTLPARKGVKVGKPAKIMTAAMRSKTAFPTAGGTTTGSGGNFYSPELSTDFLELPQSVDEQRNFIRFFYDNHPFVGQAIDLLTELPLSKVRLSRPDAKNSELAEKSLRFCERWAKKIKLLPKLIGILHELNLIGEVFVFVEDTSPDIPEDIRTETIREVTVEGEAIERKVPYADADTREVEWLKKNYKGWTALRVLPPEQIHMESFSFSDEKIIQLIPDSKTKNIVAQAQQGDPNAIRVSKAMPQEIVNSIMSGTNIPLNTDPEAGSFVHYIARKRSDYQEHGKSMVQRCLLPGTPIWIKRDGIIQQVAVEEVNDVTDLLLTHKGRFMPCKAGSREVNEQITALTIENVAQPLALTSDHEVLRVKDDGTEEWVEAGKLKTGDFVRESHVVPEKQPVVSVDLAEWWQGRQIKSWKRGRPKYPSTERTVTAVDIASDEEGLTVTFEYPGDNRGCVDAIPKMQKLLSWLQNLTEPAEVSYDAIMAVTGLTYQEIRSYVCKFRKELGLKTENRCPGYGGGRITKWYPADKNLQVPGAFAYYTEISPTKNINITEEFCYLLGTWLGDGCIWTTSDPILNVDSLGWALHDTEPEIRDRIIELLGKIFGSQNLIFGSLIADEFADDGNCSVRIDDPLLGRWFMEEFGHTAQGKRLPEWIFNLPDSHILALLRGLLDTDGCLQIGGAHSVVFELDNKCLLDQLHLLCNRLGLKTQVQKRVCKSRNWTRSWKTKTGVVTKIYSYVSKTYFSLGCSRAEDVHCLAVGEGVPSVKGQRAVWTDKSYKWNSRIVNGWLTRKIKNVDPISYKGPVFSFDVSEDNSHVTVITTHNCLRALVWEDVGRQALTSIASRHMTPYRIVTALDMNDDQTEVLREQVDMALQDPDYSIIANFEINWQEMGADQRLPDWSWAMELANKELYAGLGVTESLLTGEGAYGGDRLHLEVINTRFMLVRELMQDLVEEYFFKPMCKRMGFVEEDEDGNLDVIVPRLSFTRLALRDNSDTFDALFNLYQKGSLDIDIILDLLNIDPVTTREKLKRDVFTLNDSSFNELLRNAYSKIGDNLVEGSDVTEKVAEHLGLTYTKPKEDGGRF